MSAGRIQNGVYLVIDPSVGLPALMAKLQLAVTEKISAIQIWDNFSEDCPAGKVIGAVLALCRPLGIPVLINNQWEWLLETDLDGVHFDVMPEQFERIKNSVARRFIAGITCNNDLAGVRWAEANGLDYVSFCSVFPSSTANSCDLVAYDTIKAAREITSKPIFLAGGITPENIGQLEGLDYSGVAVVSGVMSAAHPGKAIKNYLQQLNNLRK